jgi:hypothetical protein
MRSLDDEGKEKEQRMVREIERDRDRDREKEREIEACGVAVFIASMVGTFPCAGTMEPGYRQPPN